ncbi:hypothetical protein RhiirB3_476196, partial [Rhizophagus irregularis]
MTKAMEAERAMDMEKSIVQDTYGPNSKSSSDNDKRKATEKSKAVTKDLSRDPSLPPQNIVNNVNGTNKDKINLQADQGSQPMDVDPSNLNKDPSIITIEKVKEHIALVPFGELIGGKNLKTTKIKKALQTYNIQYNKQLPVIYWVSKVRRQVREIRESFEDLGEIEKIYTRGAGLYQVAFITYKDATSIDYFKEQWSYHINKDIVRVLPLLLSKEEREKRKQFSLRLSGLHYQTSGYDLKEVMTQCKGKTCFIPAVMIRGKYQRCRYAYIHFSSRDDLVAARQMNIEFKKGNAGTRQLYWSKEEDRICNICGNPTHMAKDCTNKDINKSQSK